MILYFIFYFNISYFVDSLITAPSAEINVKLTDYVKRRAERRNNQDASTVAENAANPIDREKEHDRFVDGKFPETLDAGRVHVSVFSLHRINFLSFRREND